jgi:Bacterial Ig-like domain (group 1)
VTADGQTLTATVVVTTGPPASITVASGSGQSAKVNSTFAGPLVVTVLDRFGNPVADASVSFTAPTRGAGANFPGGATVRTDGNGQASLSVAANAAAGNYTVTASVSGVSTAASFRLTNTAAPPRPRPRRRRRHRPPHRPGGRLLRLWQLIRRFAPVLFQKLVFYFGWPPG